MLDVFGIPGFTGESDVQIFTQPQTVDNLQWSTWTKPRGKSMCFILAMSGGGGGGGGLQHAAGTAHSGGGGGASSGVARAILPLYFLPDNLYIQVGAGGAGGGNTVAGGSGVLSYVNIYPDNTTVTNSLLISGAAAPTGGGAGTSGAGGTGGTGGTSAAIANMPLAGLGNFDFIGGQVGTAGGALGAIGVAQSIPVTGCIAMGGTGGGGTAAAGGTFAGGLITAIASSYLSQVRPQVTAAIGESGSAGLWLLKPLWSFGGLGGFSGNAVAGGNGGHGAPGAGGGGSGAGIVSAANLGGRGGNGLVIIVCW